MAIVWKINGTALATLGAENVVLRLANQAADVLSFEIPMAFDGTAAFALGDEITLTRTVDADPAVTWFRGYLRGLPRAAGGDREGTSYEARGGWDLLERRAYLQIFKQASDLEDPESTLVDVRRGRVILAQDDTGAKVSLSSAVSDIAAYAVDSGAPLQVGTVSLGSVTVPWDETTDVSCAAAIGRLLQWRPDAVAWFDYTTTPPTFNCVARGSLSSVSLAVKPAGVADNPALYAPIESISIAPRPDLQVERVALFYIATNRTNEAVWEKVTTDVAPAGTTGREDNCLVRTIQLAGSVYQSSILEQRIKTEIIPTAVRATYTTPITTGSDFTALQSWWKKHDAALGASNVTIKAFLRGGLERIEPAAPDMAPVTQPTYELLNGAITDWMKDYQGVDVEQQTIRAEVLIEVADPAVPARKELMVHPVAVTVTATNAAKSLYTFLESDSFLEAEDVPTGLASAIRTALNHVQYQGSITLVEREASGLAKVGQKLNLTGSRTEWETMAALIQETQIQVNEGRTSVVIGPAGSIDAGGLVELARTNRTRQPVASSMVRIGGRRVTPAARPGLGVFQPTKAAGSLSSGQRIFNTTV